MPLSLQKTFIWGLFTIENVLMNGYSLSCLEIILLLCSFTRIIERDFSPKGTWPSWSQVLGRVSSIKYEFHLMEWPLSPFRTWLVTPVTWAALLLSLSWRQVAVLGHRVWSWVVVMTISLLCSMKSTFHGRQEWRLWLGTSLISPCSITQISVVFLA